PIAAASDFTARVLARPGTPSTSMCPRDSRATNMRSSRWSWPTMVFLTSYSTCSMGLAGAPGRDRWPLGCCPLINESSLLGSPAAAPRDGRGDGYGETDADEGAGAGGIGQGYDNADRLAARVDQWAAGAARVDRRVELDEVRSGRAFGGGDAPVEPGDDAGG